MLKIITTIIEVLCVLGAILFAILWMKNPEGDYEPYLAFCAALAVGLELIRRYMRSLQTKVFLSVGATYTNEQEQYVKAFEHFLIQNKCIRLVVGRDSPAARQPILQIVDLMKKSDAVIVLAFTRYIINNATEKPGSSEQKNISQTKYPTIWNQIEAAMGYTLNRPLLVIYEEDLKQEAMLKDRLEFRTIKSPSPIDPKLFETQHFQRVFEDFIKIVRRRSIFRL